MLVNHQYKRKYPIFPIVENTTLKNSDPSELRTTGSMGPRKEEEENNCGRTAEVIEHPIAAPEFDFVFVYWHLILVTPDGPRFRSTFLPRLPLAMVVLF